MQKLQTSEFDALVLCSGRVEESKKMISSQDSPSRHTFAVTTCRFTPSARRSTTLTFPPKRELEQLVVFSNKIASFLLKVFT
ncbi:unnamed protein product [Protopolystoma xenopodis]|uniref:Uncharacterized protein n=1 Tax=Protopolystoma xenopodis TaxID=117903 RepID=A0A448XRS6_9PLAT|nr:unnamed protein product [Protopolystoma xenopodis]